MRRITIFHSGSEIQLPEALYGIEKIEIGHRPYSEYPSY
jgi:hypothetical protein